MEESLLFSSEGVAQVRDIIGDNIDHQRPLGKEVALPRVPNPLRTVKPEAYIPNFVSFGPYHHSTLIKDNVYRRLKVSTGEKYKLMSVEKFSRNLQKHGMNFGSIVERIQGLLHDIESFYGQKISRDGDKDGDRFGDGYDFALMMGLDASFLLCFVNFCLFGGYRQEDDEIMDLSTLHVCIKCDILKLENQIPLDVLKEVYEHWRSSYGINSNFNEMLYITCLEFCPFLFSPSYNALVTSRMALDGKRHLLDCMHAFISPLLDLVIVGDNQPLGSSPFQKLNDFLESVVRWIGIIFNIRHPQDQGRHDFIKAYNAEHLAKAGIKFKSFEPANLPIRFDRNSGTLFLPRITVSPIHTEVFLRNVLALEFNDEGGPKNVMRYVGLMDCLIDTPNDVRLLRKCRVISRSSVMLTDGRIAEMWNGMCQPFLIGQFEPEQRLKYALMDVINRRYYKNKMKRFLWKCIWEPVSRPGKGVALVAGFLILLMTAIQTYCNLHGLFLNKT